LANPAPIADTRADARARKRAKRAERRDKDYLRWLHTWRCLCCASYAVEAHHQPRHSQADWHDRKTLPLCAVHHRGKDGIHMLGVEGFERRWNISIEAEIAKLNAKYEEEHSDR